MAETEEVTVTMALQDGYQFLVGSGLALGILTDHGPAGPRRVDGRQHVLVRWRLVDPTVDDPARPVLLALSDNGPQMTSGSTREFMALCAIHQHFGRPGPPVHCCRCAARRPAACVAFLLARAVREEHLPKQQRIGVGPAGC